MFGYIVPDKPELKVKELDTFKGYYCGLCKQLKTSYTFFSRLFLNYDCTFLSLILDAVNEDMPQCNREACSFSPFHKKCILRAGTSKYAAAINVLLAKNSIRDHIRDEKKFYLFPAQLMLVRGYRKARRDYPNTAACIENALDRLNEMEESEESDIDRVSDVFAVMLSELTVSGAETEKIAFKHLGYHIGRWLYLIDAYDDLERDIKTKAYNPLIYRFQYYSDEKLSAFRKRIDEDIRFNLYYSLSEAANAFELIAFKKNRALLENIIYMGLKKRTEQVLAKGATTV